jgi:hypothetical protein
MDNLIIRKTDYTPEIILNTNGNMSFRGKSYSENVFEFYAPIMNWIEEYFKNNHTNQTIINMEIIYFNSSSSKQFFDFFDILDEANENNDIKINWICNKNNEYAQDSGEMFQEDFENLKIEIKIVN